MSLSQMERGKTLGEGSRPIRLAGSALSNRAHICAFFNGPDDAYRVLLPFIKEGLVRMGREGRAYRRSPAT